MSRRLLTLAVLTIASMVATACGTSPTAPRDGAPIAPVVIGGTG